MVENIPFPKYLQNKTRLDHKEEKKKERKKSDPNNINLFLKNFPLILYSPAHSIHILLPPAKCIYIYLKKPPDLADENSTLEGQFL